MDEPGGAALAGSRRRGIGRRLLVVLVALVCVGATLVGCSDGSGESEDQVALTDDAASDDEAPSSAATDDGADNDDDSGDADSATAEPTATPLPEPTATTEPTATPTPEPTVQVAPLTGVPVDDDDLDKIERPALMVKIDNSEDARPQVGLNDADQVLEILVEGITRLAMVFHSGESNPVGPVRSGRSSDPNIAANYGQPLFAWSGGNPGVTAEIRAAEVDGKLYDVGAFQITDYFRDNSIASGGRRYAPHNYFSTTDVLWSHAPDELGPPPQLFDYQGADYEAPFDAYESPGVHLSYTGGVTADMVWDPDVSGYRRWQRDTPHVDDQEQQVAPANVVVLFTQYVASRADTISPQAVSVGDGRALVLTQGRTIPGFWDRATFSDPWSIVDADGAPIELTPGQTWILLPKPGEVAELTDDEAADLLASLPDEQDADADAETDAETDETDDESSGDADEDAG